MKTPAKLKRTDWYPLIVVGVILALLVVGLLTWGRGL